MELFKRFLSLHDIELSIRDVRAERLAKVLVEYSLEIEKGKPIRIVAPNKII